MKIDTEFLVYSDSKGRDPDSFSPTLKKFPQSWVFNILKRESTIPPNEEIIRRNICNVEFEKKVCFIIFFLILNCV